MVHSITANFTQLSHDYPDEEGDKMVYVDDHRQFFWLNSPPQQHPTVMQFVQLERRGHRGAEFYYPEPNVRELPIFPPCSVPLRQKGGFSLAERDVLLEVASDVWEDIATREGTRTKGTDTRWWKETLIALRKRNLITLLDFLNCIMAYHRPYEQ